MVEIKIRKATKKDIPQLVRIVKGVTSIEDYPGEYNKFLFEKMLKDNETTVIVAEINREVIGFNQFTLNKDKVMYVESLAVLKKYQGNGIASKLLEVMEDLAKKKKIKKIIFIVREWNNAMNHLAKKRKYKLKTKFNLWEK